MCPRPRRWRRAWRRSDQPGDACIARGALEGDKIRRDAEANSIDRRHAYYRLAAGCEISVETNPNSLDREKLAFAKPDALVMHPGPMNRGVEIDSDVADGPHSVILDQVTNGVAVRMAVLYLLAGGRPELAEAAKGRGGDA